MANKGSPFEREMCRTLSLWLSKGKRDDIFWRSSMSGGRATVRTKQGKTTFGSYGDIAAVDPIGLKLLDHFTIELKRGYSRCTPIDLIDSAVCYNFKPKDCSFVAFLRQAICAHKAAGSKSWMLIHRRNKKEAMVYVHALRMEAFEKLLGDSLKPRIEFRQRIPLSKGVDWSGRIVGVPLSVFLVGILPEFLDEV